MITVLAAIGKHNEIGYNNKLLWHIPEDMLHFKNYTMGKPIIMGRKTFESIGRQLPGRLNIIISKQNIPGIATINVSDIIDISRLHNEVVIIGGASIYSQVIGIADRLIITHVDAEFTADTFFPEIDMTIWEINTVIRNQDANYTYSFVEYIKYET